MKRFLLLTGLLLATATLSAQVTPDTFQRITSTASPGVSYDVGVAGSDGSFSIVKTGAGQRLTIDASGNVTVLNNLTVNGTFTANNFAGGAVTGGATGLTLNAGGTNQNVILTPSGTGQVIVASGRNLRVGGYGSGTNDGILFSRSDTGSMGWMAAIGSTNSLSIGNGAIVGTNPAMSLNLSTGNVGIGTTAPSTLLSIQGSAPMINLSAPSGSLTLDGVSSPGIRMTANANGGSASYLSDASAGVYTTASTLGSYPFNEAGNLVLQSRGAGAVRDIVFVTGNAPTTRMVIDRNGSVGVGTSTPTAKLDVAGTLKVSGDATLNGNLGIGLGGSATSATLDVGTDIRVRRDLYVDGVIHVASGNVQAATSTDAINITSTTDSSGYATGALIVSGGAGIAKNLHVGQSITAVGTINGSAVQVGGQAVWHAGNFNPANYLQQSGGIVNGGASGLTINAGATNQNLVLDSDGTGRIEVRDTLAITNASGIQHLLMGNQDSTGLNNPAILRASNGAFEFGRGNSWAGQGGTFTSNVTFSNNGRVGVGTTAPASLFELSGSGTEALLINSVYSNTASDGTGVMARKARGTQGSPAAVQTDDVIGALYGGGYTSAGSFGVNSGRFAIHAAQNYSGSAQGSYMTFAVTPNNSASRAEVMRITAAGDVGIGIAAPTAKLDVEGNVRVGSGALAAWGDLYLSTNSGWNGIAYPTIGSVGGTTGSLIMLHNPHVPFRTDNAAPGNSGRAGIRAAINTTASTWWDFGLAGDFFHVYRNGTGEFLRVTNTGNVGIGTASPTAKLDVSGSGRVGGDLNVTANTAIGGTLGVSGQANFTGNVGVGTTTPFMKMQVNNGNLAVTGTNGGVVHLANNYPGGEWGVRLAGIDNASNGHDLVVQTRTSSGGAFSPALTVKSDGTTGLSGDLKFFSPTGGWWGFDNTAGSLSLFRESTTGSARTSVATFGLDNNVAFTGRISVAAPSGAGDAATKGYVDDTNPWNWDPSFGWVSMKDPNDWLGLGTVQPAAPLHVQSSALFGEIARFGAGGVNLNLNLRSYITLQNQNSSRWWEFSVENQLGGGGGESGFALRSRYPDEPSKPRLYVSEGVPAAPNQRSFMRLYNQNVDAGGWELSVQGPDSNNPGMGNGLAFRETVILSNGTPHSLPPSIFIAHTLDNNIEGNVGIGTNNPGAYRLAVNGAIRAKEVVVEANWADYVFEEDYDLKSLAEVEAHIKEKKHLPGVPSAKEVAANGVNVGEMQATLLAKVEELTLHMIAQQKEIAALRQQVAELRAAQP